MFQWRSKASILFIIQLILIAITTRQTHSVLWSLDDLVIIRDIKDTFKSILYSLEPDETIPYSNAKLLRLIHHLPTHENDPQCFKDEICAKEWLERADRLQEKVAEKGSYLEFNFVTNITDYNQKLIEEFAPISSKFGEVMLEVSKKFYANSYNWNNHKIKRMMYLASRGYVITDPDEVRKSAQINAELESIYAKAKVCGKSSNDNKCYSLDSELTEIMQYSRNYDELLWAWKGWSDVTGPKMKQLYIENVKLQNKAVMKYGYNDLSEVWMEDFEMDNFENIMDDLYNQVKPYYQELHAYVRRKLRDFYGNDKIKSKYIPAHLLGNMWAQNWENIYDIVAPYRDIEEPKITEALKLKGYTPMKIFEEAEEFFTSLGLEPMTSAFWKNSMIVKPDNRDVQCHASATDLQNGYDFRIKMCTEVTEDDFNTVHHEMGHIEYYMSYKDQPSFFKSGANSGFHEAIGDTIQLAVITEKHLKMRGIIDEINISYEANINFLMRIALKNLAFLPFGYMIDKWRWNVFRGKISPDDYNKMWWKMRQDYQGVESPIERTENDFDPGSKYHIPSNVPYARYFVSHIHQFQFYRALCKLSNHKGALHECDFYGSLPAGYKFKKMLSLGSSKHWTYALKILTDEDTINLNAFVEYFQPLFNWLKTENSKYISKIDEIGW